VEVERVWKELKICLFRRHYLGIELLDCYFKMVELQWRKKRPEIKHAIAYPLPWETSKKDQPFDQKKFVQWLKRLQREQRIKANQVYLTLGSQWVSVYKPSIPVRIKNQELKDWLHKNVIQKVTKEEVIFDYFPLENLSKTERKVMLFVVSKNLIDTLEEIFLWANLELMRVQFSTLSLFYWLQFVRQRFFYRYCTFRFTVNGVEIGWFRNGQLEGVKYLPISLFSFADQQIDFSNHLLNPMVVSAKKIVAFGEQFLPKVHWEMEQWFRENSWLPDEWILTGEGLDLAALQRWLARQISTQVTLDFLPKGMLSPKLQRLSTEHFGASLSVCMGSILDGRDRS
jgi:hypothetical protein